MKKQAGFSLVELVIVIIVVGLLAVAALPRFLNVTDEAKKAQIEGVAGGYATAVLSARAQWEAYGRPVQGEFNRVNYDGTEFYLSTKSKDSFLTGEGYPVSANQNQINDIDETDCVWLMEELLQNPPQVTSDSAEAVDGKNQFYAIDASSGVNKECRYYQLASANSQGTTNNITSGHYFSYKPAKGQVEVTLK
ncbi:prepilin-type N-terminal cleavage/methylation domain-containing protein [Photobacterium sp. ZSDE20]|uniref:Prepilin-type N-terminal cleavage/methylation domain-containing protein n=1 Tax=Photobacterium pectinilyticum TaxID=2906793 RepID=A0ABT1MXB5_9GAMM|nr:prepilin-type N-terminal cleavage/methylation domain-containing protein [Photobacterium sp. ZSDE20]MCQ1057130.1 prepilin-type N-terminal cleavage/methylation domain-containing protein [Photobacterium sp. ZSDE20]MDD1821265.1 prepilin-type N-terminal cleavage/methylation domain-containing protein [Photobacterium sp. ZSDE20]